MRRHWRPRYRQQSGELQLDTHAGCLSIGELARYRPDRLRQYGLFNRRRPQCSTAQENPIAATIKAAGIQISSGLSSARRLFIHLQEARGIWIMRWRARPKIAGDRSHRMAHQRGRPVALDYNVEFKSPNQVEHALRPGRVSLGRSRPADRRVKPDRAAYCECRRAASGNRSFKTPERSTHHHRT